MTITIVAPVWLIVLFSSLFLIGCVVSMVKSILEIRVLRERRELLEEK
jgi:hypothetical protein